MAENLLSIKNLTVTVNDINIEKKLINDISLEIPALSIVALVGGSGSGKTTTGLSILRLLPPALKISQGEIIFSGINILEKTEDQMRGLRGKEIGMVFQEPLVAFNPVFSVGYQINEVLECHTTLNRQLRQARILDLLQRVGIDDPKRVAQNYPHQLSGGLRQRVMIAQAIAASPKLIIADEPTSNLDVTLQAKIMDLFRTLRKELNLSILLITHDLGLVSHLADQVVVMQQGKVVEAGATDQVLTHPKHVYTQQLIETVKI